MNANYIAFKVITNLSTLKHFPVSHVQYQIEKYKVHGELAQEVFNKVVAALRRLGYMGAE